LDYIVCPIGIIGPGAVVCGNVSVGENSFIGAISVIKENISIGKKVTVGAGSVVIRDIPDNVKVVGNPDRIIK
jgi:serine acetyltransferase